MKSVITIFISNDSDSDIPNVEIFGVLSKPGFISKTIPGITSYWDNPIDDLLNEDKNYYVQEFTIDPGEKEVEEVIVKICHASPMCNLEIPCILKQKHVKKQSAFVNWDEFKINKGCTAIIETIPARSTYKVQLEVSDTVPQ